MGFRRVATEFTVEPVPDKATARAHGFDEPVAPKPRLIACRESHLGLR